MCVWSVLLSSAWNGWAAIGSGIDVRRRMSQGHTAKPAATDKVRNITDLMDT